MNDCYFDKKDWRTCKKEVRLSAALIAFHWKVSTIQLIGRLGERGDY